jgi:hypothetical protein
MKVATKRVLLVFSAVAFAALFTYKMGHKPKEIPIPTHLVDVFDPYHWTPAPAGQPPCDLTRVYITTIHFRKGSLPIPRDDELTGYRSVHADFFISNWCNVYVAPTVVQTTYDDKGDVQYQQDIELPYGVGQRGHTRYSLDFEAFPGDLTLRVMGIKY